MKWHKILTLFFSFVATSLLLYAILPDADLVFLLKMLALSTAITIFVGLFYYKIRGAKKGDKVVVYRSSIFPFVSKEGRLMGNAKIGEEVKVSLDDGGEVIGVLEEYESFFYPHKVRVIYEERKV